MKLSNTTNDELSTAFFASCSTLALVVTILNIIQTIARGVNTYLSLRNLVLSVLIAIMNGTFILFFVTHRQKTANTDHSPKISGVWAFLGTYMPVFFLYNNFKQLPLVDTLIGVSTLFAVAATLKLGKSSDILVANRGIVTKGPYSVVRHPLYASYLLTNAVYMIISPFYIWRVCLFLFWVFCILKRIYYEEKLLNESREYREYAKQVKYKIVPYIW